MDYSDKGKEIAQKAVDLLRRHKNVDLQIAKVGSKAGHVFTITSSHFKGGCVDFYFTPDWYDPDSSMWIDDYVDYGNLSGEQKIAARFACYLYEYWKEPGDVCTRLRLHGTRVKK